MQIKVSVNTPARQAKNCMATQKSAMLGYTGARSVIKEVLVDGEHFYWILEIAEKDLQLINNNTARGEIIIRKFYSTLFKVVGRVNAIGAKFGKAGQWFRKQLLKRMAKLTGDNAGMMDYINKQSDDELADFMKITDKEAVQKLLAGELIKVEVLNEAVPK